MLSSVKEKLQNGTYSIPGDQWPLFMWKDSKYDPEDAWNGLLRSRLMIAVSISRLLSLFLPSHVFYFRTLGLQACFHVAELSRSRTKSDTVRKCQATWDDQGQRRVLGLHCYSSPFFLSFMIFTNQKAKQVRFALSSSPIFTRTDAETDSARFYNSVLEFLDDPDERNEVDQLLEFWNQYVI